MTKEKIALVINNKSSKTIVVQTQRIYKDKKYQKILKKRKNYLVHDENNICSIGDLVLIEQVKPISRHKNWILKTKLN